MRAELERIEKIEQYLNNTLSPEDKAAFQQQLATDPGLKEELRLQEELMKGIERAALKQKIQIAKTSFIRGKNFTRWGLGGLSAAIIVTGLFLYRINTATTNEYALPELNEQGEKQWADADKNLPAQTYTIDASKDTVIETKAGIVMAIQAHNFLDENGNAVDGNIQLRIKEALDAATILKGGLSTKAGNDLLESGGMFYIDARKDDHILKINPAYGIRAEIPANEIKAGMQLFSGKRKPDGSIDWVDPKPLEHDLVPFDIKKLNFYPGGYLDSLKHWGYNATNKAFTDSLYYSFASLFSQRGADLTTTIRHDTSLNKGRIVSDSISLPPNGRTLFLSKCASCHHVSKDATGPKLGGVLDNDYYKGDIKKMSKWIYNVNAMINSEPHYRELKATYGSVMTQFDSTVLTEQELGAIYDYIDNSYKYGLQDDYYADLGCGINPAKIKAIWNDQFQNTILATREFEERLWWIHELRDPALLDLYVNNLDQPLWYIDSLANRICHSGEMTNPFPRFIARHDGKVKNGSRQFELLRNYYTNKTKAFTEAITKTQNEFWNKQAELDNDASGKSIQHQADSTQRISENFMQELDLNLKDAYRQLGYDTSRRIIWGTKANVYQANITNMGWCNVDRYVYESTVNRTTLNYTDPESGKKAVINYTPVSIEINNWKEYDRLYVYLLPDKLNSFMRLDGSGGKYAEKLDELMSYDLVCIAYKDERPHFYSQKAIQPGNYQDIILGEVSKDELAQRLAQVGSRTQTAAMKNENDFFQFEISDIKRKKHNMELKELTERIRSALFPCYGMDEINSADLIIEKSDYEGQKK